MLGLFAQGEIDVSTLDFRHAIFYFFAFGKATLFTALSWMYGRICQNVAQCLRVLVCFDIHFHVLFFRVNGGYGAGSGSISSVCSAIYMKL
uniref:Uncharacterized protein n=1 Tax=Anguilla anguilla TaxID=7936 RepID=A0A0E9S8P0_ANGAN